MSSRKLRFDGWTLDLESRDLEREGVRIRLQEQPMRVLQELIAHAGSVVTREQLIALLWPKGVVDFDTGLNTTIRKLRCALGDVAETPRYIETFPRRGYRFIGTLEPDPGGASGASPGRVAVSEPETPLQPAAPATAISNSPVPIEAAAAAPAKASAPASRAPQSGAPESSAAQSSAPESGERAVLVSPQSSSDDIQARAWRLRATTVIVATAAALVLVAYLLARHARTVPLAAVEPSASIAVMPFANLTGEANKDSFSDGMAEELINELTKVPGLKVPARTSSFAYKGRNVDIRQIARDLGVATILEGSVRSAGARIRVTAQLVNAQTGYHIWSQSYDRDFGDVFKLQDDISAQIVEALKHSLNAQLPAVGPRAAPTSDPEAYRLYLQARSASEAASMDAALRLNTQATSRDPNFARAWANMAITRAGAAALGTVSANALADTEHDANRAFALDPNLTETQTALAIINAWRGDWNAAETRFRRAADLAPRDVGPLAYRAPMLSSSAGQLRRALEEEQEAYALAPASTGVIAGLAAIYSLMGQDREALRYADLAADLGGARGSLSALARQNAALRRGRCIEAGELILPALPAPLRSPAGSSTVRQVFAGFCAPAERSAASGALATLLRSVKPEALGIQPRLQIITWYVMLGDLGRAFDFANHSVDEYARSGTVGTNWGGLWLPEMRPFRKDPRFQPFVARLKLLDYWRQHGPPDDCDLREGRLACR